MRRFVLCFLVAACADETDLARVDANEWLPGGDTTNTLLLGVNAFALPATNITAEHESVFHGGNSFFNQSWVTAPSSTTSRDGLGPLFNARSCGGCHSNDGRGRPPVMEDEDFLGLLLRMGVPDQDGQGADGGAPLPEPTYGGQLQPFSVLDVPAEGRPRVSYAEIAGAYDDGETYVLLEPSYEIIDLAYGPLAANARVSPRVAPAVTGLGLLQAIPLERLESLVDAEDADGDGISGRLNHVPDVMRGTTVEGRFGWKAEQPTVRQQSAGAFLGDVGVTSMLFPEQECTDAQSACLAQATGGEPEISDDLLDRVDLYARLLAVPVRERFDDDVVLRGKLLFQESGCTSCHAPSHETAATADFEELREQLIWPYTDLLLHDMGEALSDNRPTFEADGREWRTPPLWGLRFYEVVNNHNRLLHDGRARGVAEAILWHAGEAESARDRFRALSADDRQALIEFVESL